MMSLLSLTLRRYAADGATGLVGAALTSVTAAARGSTTGDSQLSWGDRLDIVGALRSLPA